MTMEQFQILGMLRRDGAKFHINDVMELDWFSFSSFLKQFTWNDPPIRIMPKLIANDGRYDYTFDVYDFGGYKVAIYYGESGGPTVFIVFGDAGEYVFTRSFEDAN